MPEFSLLSLNTFGVPFYLSSWRIKQLAFELTRISPSIICLQEIQQNAYLPLLQRGLAAHRHYIFYRNRLAPKGGLVTAAQPCCPITRSEFVPFSNQGRWLSIGVADRALNKGVLATNLDIGGSRIVVMNTHLQANYLSNWQPSNLQTQIQLDQVKTLAELSQAQPENSGVIICGDFNFPRRTPAYNLMVEQSGLTDALVEDPRPTYQPFPLVPSKWLTSLDYVFYRPPKGEEWDVTADILPIVNSHARRPFQRFLTDHQALVLNINPQAIRPAPDI